MVGVVVLGSYFGLFTGYRTGRTFFEDFEFYYESQREVIAPIVGYKESL